MTNEIINCTPHEINLISTQLNGHDLIVAYPPSGILIRVDSTEEVVSSITLNHTSGVFNDVEYPVSEMTLGEVTITGTEDAEVLPIIDGTFYVVSRIAAEAMMGRTDLLLVHNTQRDENGRIIGCTGFARLPTA